MKRLVGLLDKIRVIKESPLMVRFTLVSIDKSYNCIVVKPALTTMLMMLLDGKYNISASGHSNKKNQFVVEAFTIRNPDKIAKGLGL